MAQRYSQPIPAQSTKSPQPEGGVARQQRTTHQPRPQTPSNATPSLLGSAAAKMGKMAHSVTLASPTKIKSVLTGNKKRALEIERTATPTPQTYSDQGLIIGGPESMGHHPSWADDIPSSGEEDDGEGDQNSMQTDITGNLAERLMNKDERLANLYSSLAEAGNLVQALENEGELEDARENQYITGCMTGLTNTLLQQPYRIIMEQQAELLKTVLEINKTVTALAERVVDNGEKVELLREEAVHNATAVTEQLRSISSVAADTQSRIVALEGKAGCPLPWAPVTQSNTEPVTSHATGPLYKPKGKPDANPRSTKPNTNPLSAHHPCRAVIRFLPDGIKEGDRMEPALVVNTINNALANSQALKAKHIKAVAATYNNQGNLIVSTRADQRATDLLQFVEIFLPLISQGYTTSALEDKRWFKIQVDGVSTHTMANYRPRTLLAAETVHEELRTCNPAYAQAADHIVSPPRWMRTQEELKNTLRSSLVFAVDDEDIAKELLWGNSLAAFARYCPLRAYQDRPPVKQCKNCWGWDHVADNCKAQTRCRLCAGDHKEEEHNMDQECRKCKALEESDGMVVDKVLCTHYLHCANCSTVSHITEKDHAADARRCPVRLDKYGTARSNERKALKSDNPWKVASARKPRKAKGPKNDSPTTQKVAPEQLACQNQFSAFEDFNLVAHIEEDTTQ